MIKIMNAREINKGCLRKEISIVIEKWGGFIINNIKVFEKDNQRWLQFPSNPYEKEGETKYFQVNGFEKAEMKEAFQKKVFEALDDYEPAS